MEFKHMHLKVLLDHLEYDTSALSEETAIAQLRAAGLLNWKGLAKDVPSPRGKTVINLAVGQAIHALIQPLVEGAVNEGCLPVRRLRRRRVVGEGLGVVEEETDIEVYDPSTAPTAKPGETWMVSIGGEPRLRRRMVIGIGSEVIVLGRKASKQATSYDREHYLPESVRFVQQVGVGTKGA
ncbi:hypothetical protein [Pseudomonas aeruginosa]|uniref:hypothetical protein n=1 Tax=Pseudomonas aeruginosa TaxID=287 RepID=UPI0011C166BE|nr:hypothetical protein [Pseudomonas aeruginosa]MBH3656025.1 hypothetical protein [Pseudomonas aeruginosa]NPY29735.1 hypothetical protein [Pseudomonas aeruginosa]HBO1323895.1 hypothetical protein [Pseudomonas aeruginosa]HBO9091783.1 hypothetical protein [Pseudomonas aeruginosa]HCK4566672.1 hypothetical protein [Pseudomonas aeruginosa]